MKKSLESLKSTKFENKQLTTSQTQNVKGGDDYCTPAGYRAEVGLYYNGDCCKDGKVVEYDYATVPPKKVQD